MRHATVFLVTALLIAACAATGSDPPPVGPPLTAAPPQTLATVDPSGTLTGLRADLVADDLVQPVDVAVADGRILVVEKAGRIVAVDDGQAGRPAVLDLTSLVGSVGNEQGLLTLELHPGYATNGRAFVFYTDSAGASVLAEYVADRDRPDRFDPDSGRILLTVPQPHEYHQSGAMVFAPDGALLVSIGDGGGSDDAYGNGQDPSTLLGAILRLDVDAAHPYAVPPDNPFVEAESPGRPEVWATGVRNPWRLDVDPVGDLLYVADVGQQGYEEINVVPVAAGGLNYGWPITEGRDCRAPGCDQSGLVAPIAGYDHDRGCAIVGGVVYRGRSMPELHGRYFYADYCAGWIRSLRWDGSEVVDEPEVLLQAGSLGTVTTIGTDADGELLVTTLEGRLFRLVPVRDQDGP